MPENKNQKPNKTQLQIQEMKNALTILDENDIADVILNKVNEMQHTGKLMFPPNYAVGNALKSAYLIIQNVKDKNDQPALKVCARESIALSLLDMVVQGLNPAKTQCYFIVRGNQLTLNVSYFGQQKIAKAAIPTIGDIYATEIYEGDEIEIEVVNGKKIVKSHKTKFENRDNPVVGVYSIINNNGNLDYEIMTMKEIQAAWNKSSTKTQTVHKEFPQEMAKKSVIYRHCKRYIRTSDDANIFAQEAYERTVANEYIRNEPNNQIELQDEVDNTANQEELIIEGESVETPAEQPQQENPTSGPGF